MKTFASFTAVLASLFLAAANCCCSAFTVLSPGAHPSRTRTTTSSSSYYRFIHNKATASDDTAEDLSLDEEVERLLQNEKTKAAKLGKISSETGNKQFAPWMSFNAEDERKLKAVLREKAIAARKQRSSMRDSTNQELSGTGLQYKVVSNGNAVELEWATASEKNTLGYLLQRRAAKTDEWNVVADYKSYGPLASKGVDGGVYRYLDETVQPGSSYVYRVTECENNGQESDLSQCLVDIQTESEQKLQVAALAGFGIVAAAALAAGFLLDPIQ